MSELLQIREHHSLQQLLEPELALTCPHCEVFAQMTPQPTPSWQWLMSHRPKRIGVSALCPACHRPVFLISGPAVYSSDQITLEGSWEPVLKPLERFELDLLPASIVDTVTEALSCYRDGYYQAFVLLSHRITDMSAHELGADGRLRLFNAVTFAAEQAGIDNALTRLCREILFNLDHSKPLPVLPASAAKVLLALLRDILYEAFVRHQRLAEAMPKRG
ncbi:MAG: hypothetical protein AAFR91_09630 [Pseudomonadota bacterium]